jgi:hypothetical protein
MTLIEIGHYFAVAMDGLIFLFGSIVLAGGALAYLTMSQEKANGLRAAR